MRHGFDIVQHLLRPQSERSLLILIPTYGDERSHLTATCLRHLASDVAGSPEIDSHRKSGLAAHQQIATRRHCPSGPPSRLEIDKPRVTIGNRTGRSANSRIGCAKEHDLATAGWNWRHRGVGRTRRRGGRRLSREKKGRNDGIQHANGSRMTLRHYCAPYRRDSNASCANHAALTQTGRDASAAARLYATKGRAISCCRCRRRRCWSAPGPARSARPGCRC